MEAILKLLESYFQNNLQSIVIYLLFFVISNISFYHLAKLKKQRLIMYQVLSLVQNVLAQKLGTKGQALVAIWVDGLSKIQDGEFSKDDYIDQFLRYIRLAARQNGIELTDTDVELLHTLIMSTLDIFMSEKPKEINNVVNKFNTMSLKN
jgi:hypothetical protein